MERNPGCNLDLNWIRSINVNAVAVSEYAQKLTKFELLKGDYRAGWLLKAITCIDLTTLGGDDTPSNISRLCHKALRPVPTDLLNRLGFSYDNDCPIKAAAVCVYPLRVEDAVATLSKCEFAHNIKVASVASGFPSGQMPLETKLREIEYAVEKGANEIDIVIDRSLVLTGQWERLYDEIRMMRKACGSEAHMKTILATGELENLRNVYKASLIAMMAGSDFIKTSTGKEAINATPLVGIVMCRAIRDYHNRCGYKVGLKPAGGIKTSNDALLWLWMVKEILGDSWLTPKLFRIGASGLLTDIEKNLYKHITGRNAEDYEFSMG